MAKGLDTAETCVVCVGSNTPAGWFREEVERALDMQTKDRAFRVIPLLLPNALIENVPQFASLRTWADFRVGRDAEFAFHLLKSGISGEAPGRWPPESPAVIANEALELAERKLQELERLRKYIREEVLIEIQRKILDQWIEK
jgi:hypothetical protein